MGKTFFPSKKLKTLMHILVLAIIALMGMYTPVTHLLQNPSTINNGAVPDWLSSATAQFQIGLSRLIHRTNSGCILICKAANISE